jgi:hypothetical protein
MYKSVEHSRGRFQRFAITVGLKEGYDQSAKTHTLNEAVKIVEDHLKERATQNKPFLTGIFTLGTVVYAWPGNAENAGEAGSANEDQVTYSGETSPLYHDGLSYDQIEEALVSLADCLGKELGQTRIYLLLDREVWIRQDDEKSTPTGETA